MLPLTKTWSASRLRSAQQDAWIGCLPPLPNPAKPEPNRLHCRSGLGRDCRWHTSIAAKAAATSISFIFRAQNVIVELVGGQTDRVGRVGAGSKRCVCCMRPAPPLPSSSERGIKRQVTATDCRELQQLFAEPDSPYGQRAIYLQLSTFSKIVPLALIQWSFQRQAVWLSVWVAAPCRVTRQAATMQDKRMLALS